MADQDNIADDDSVKNITIDKKDDEQLNDYMKKFDDLSSHNDNLDFQVYAIDDQSDDQQRLYAAIKCIKDLQVHNMKLYNLLVLMNNFFSSTK